MIIGDKFLETLVKVRDTYLTTHNKIAVLSTDYILRQSKLYLFPSGIPAYMALYICLFTKIIIAMQANALRIKSNYSG